MPSLTLFARTYGLTRDQLRYILTPDDIEGSHFGSETLSVLKNSDLQKFDKNDTRQLVLEAWNQLHMGVLHLC